MVELLGQVNNCEVPKQDSIPQSYIHYLPPCGCGMRNDVAENALLPDCFYV